MTDSDVEIISEQGDHDRHEHKNRKKSKKRKMKDESSSSEEERSSRSSTSSRWDHVFNKDWKAAKKKLYKLRDKHDKIYKDYGDVCDRYKDSKKALRDWENAEKTGFNQVIKQRDQLKKENYELHEMVDDMHKERSLKAALEANRLQQEVLANCEKLKTESLLTKVIGKNDHLNKKVDQLLADRYNKFKEIEDLRTKIDDREESSNVLLLKCSRLEDDNVILSESLTETKEKLKQSSDTIGYLTTHSSKLCKLVEKEKKERAILKSTKHWSEVTNQHHVQQMHALSEENIILKSRIEQYLQEITMLQQQLTANLSSSPLIRQSQESLQIPHQQIFDERPLTPPPLPPFLQKKLVLNTCAGPVHVEKSNSQRQDMLGKFCSLFLSLSCAVCVETVKLSNKELLATSLKELINCNPDLSSVKKEPESINSIHGNVDLFEEEGNKTNTTKEALTISGSPSMINGAFISEVKIEPCEVNSEQEEVSLNGTNTNKQAIPRWRRLPPPRRRSNFDEEVQRCLMVVIDQIITPSGKSL